MTTVMFSLPYPPSANRLWRNTDKGTLKSTEYRRWLVGASLAIPFDQRGKVTGAHRVTIQADRPDRRARDIDNLIKPILDSLKQDKAMPALKGVIRDDSDTVEISIAWTGSEPVAGAKVHVWVTALNGDTQPAVAA